MRHRPSSSGPCPARASLPVSPHLYDRVINGFQPPDTHSWPYPRGERDARAPLLVPHCYLETSSLAVKGRGTTLTHPCPSQLKEHPPGSAALRDFKQVEDMFRQAFASEPEATEPQG